MLPKTESELGTVKKHDIALRFGEMFVKHLIQVIDDFKDLIQTEIEQIYKFADLD